MNEIKLVEVWCIYRYLYFFKIQLLKLNKPINTQYVVLIGAKPYTM